MKPGSKSMSWGAGFWGFSQSLLLSVCLFPPQCAKPLPQASIPCSELPFPALLARMDWNLSSPKRFLLSWQQKAPNKLDIICGFCFADFNHTMIASSKTPFISSPPKILLLWGHTHLLSFLWGLKGSQVKGAPSLVQSLNLLHFLLE